jgi:hypothetical protein
MRDADQRPAARADADADTDTDRQVRDRAPAVAVGMAETPSALAAAAMQNVTTGVAIEDHDGYSDNRAFVHGQALPRCGWRRQ